MSQSDGFTLIELLLSIALVSVLAAFSTPVVQRWQQLNDVDVAATQIAQSLRRAQVLSQSIAGDVAWGVSLDDNDNNRIVLFQGASFAGRDSGYDEIFDLSPNVAVSGLSEVVFEKFTGSPGSTGTITLTTNTNQNRTVTINAKGMVSY